MWNHFWRRGLHIAQNELLALVMGHINMKLLSSHKDVYFCTQNILKHQNSRMHSLSYILVLKVGHILIIDSVL